MRWLDVRIILAVDMKVATVLSKIQRVEKDGPVLSVERPCHSMQSLLSAVDADEG